MATLKVGTSNGTLDFETAYQVAHEGDILDFECGYIIEMNQGFIFKKSLTLKGNFGIDSNGKRSFSNALKGYFSIANGVGVSIKNFWVTPETTEYYCFDCTSCSELSLDTVFFDNRTGDNLPLIHSEQSSKVFLRNVETRQNGVDCFCTFENSSEVHIKKSPKFYSKIKLDYSKLKIEQSTLKCQSDHLLFVENNSQVELLETTLVSKSSGEEAFSVIRISGSKMSLKKSMVIQKDFDHSIYLENNSILYSYFTRIPSITLIDSRAFLQDTSIDFRLNAVKNSYVKSNGLLYCLGNSEKKMTLYLAEYSALIAQKILFTDILYPVIHVVESSFGVSEIIDYSIDSRQNAVIEVDDTSDFKHRQSISGQAVTSQTSEMEELNELVGLRQVKHLIEQMVNQVEANQRRSEQGLKVMSQTLNSVFVGNPGTGKTTVARLLGRILFANGALSGQEFKFIEVSESELISEYIGRTATQTKEILEKARGGVLFIDEAYTLNKKDGPGYGQEAINTIMKYMEDYRDEIMIIFAGYTKEMDDFLKTNPGLASRVPNRFVFDDYTPEEIVQLGKNLLGKDQFKLEDESYYANKVAKAYASSLDKSNGRWIRNFNESLIKEQFNRVVKTNCKDTETILNSDIDGILTTGNPIISTNRENELDKLQALVGLTKVKYQVKEFIYLVEANNKKEEMGMQVRNSTLHSLFLGNPGTGKTTVARIIGKVLYQKGLINTDKFIEVSRSDLVAGYVGQTASKTREVLESALGGVLFIDEAYTLSSAGGNDFGREAIDEILKFMEDHRQDIVIIFAGYTQEMQEFLQMNPGLQSRIPTVFDFEDYTSDEIVKIGLLELKEYELDKDAYASGVSEVYSHSDKSNGRWIRNFNDKLVGIQSMRCIEKGQETFNVIENEDIEKTVAFYNGGSSR